MKRAGRLYQWRKPLVACVLLLAAYPAFVVGSVYAYWFQAGLPGGRHGPADAYRHALASATVAYTGSPHWVEWVTDWMEKDRADDGMDAMDAHNNRIGAAIGARARSWSEMQTAVRAAVDDGEIDTADADRITWLAPSHWRERLY